MKTKKILFVFLILLIFTSCKNKNTKTQTQAQTAYPSSIVSLSPSFTEILYAIGASDQISAVSDFCDYPPEATSKPIVGGFDGKTLSIEKILSYKPDLICLTDGMHNFLIESLEQYKIPYFVSNATSIEKIKSEIIEIGAITGHSSQAESVVAEMDKTLKSAVNSKNSQNNPSVSVYYEVWNSPFITAGSESFISDVISSAGGKNIFSDITDAYPIVSEETIISRNPDIILLPQSSGVNPEDLGKRSGWKDIAAVKNNKVYVVDDNLYSRPSPRIVNCVKELSGFINGEK